MDELSTDPLFRAGLADHGAGRLDRAERTYRQLLARNPDHVDARQLLAVVAYQTGRAEEAAAMLEALVAASPHRGDLWTNLGLALEFDGRLRDAEIANRQALNCPAAPPQAIGNLANILRQLWRPSEAAPLFRKALAQSPHNAGLHYNFSLNPLAEGAMEEGWREFAWRERLTPPPAWSGRRWGGEAPAGLTLRVFAEQGLGDTLLFARWLARLPKAITVQLDAPRPLWRLLASSFPAVKVLDDGGGHADAGVSLMSLPEQLGGDLRAAGPYLRSPPDLRAKWRARLADLKGLKVGIVWAGGSRPGEVQVEAVDRRRSLTLDRFGPLFDVPGVALVCLQMDRRDPMREAPFNGRMHDWTPQIDDFADTAALMQELDLVVSVDTAAAHLAGALGKELWLLSRFDSCWRWPPPEEGPSWYADVRQFRQPDLHAWDAPLEALAAALAERAREAA